jgi:EmrB/QacA subfamily drug resistance transporter
METLGASQRIRARRKIFLESFPATTRLADVGPAVELPLAPPQAWWSIKMTEPNGKSTKTWVLALASVASFMIFLDAMVVTTALSTIRQDLDTSIEALEWTVNAYNLSFAVLLLTGAALGDRLGRRRMMAAGLGLFVAASVTCALSTGVGRLIAARAAQGAGAALVIPLAMTLIGAAFPREERGKALGVFSSVSGLALIAGPAVGGAIAEGLAWQWIFWINVPLGAVVIPLVLARVPESFGAPARLDIPGLALVTGAALGVVWGLMRGNAAEWTSLEVVASLAVGIALAIAFVGFELRAREPMVPMRLFRSRAFSAGIAASFLFYAAMYGVLFFLPQFLQVAQGNTPLGTGLRLLTWTATLLVFAPIGGALVDRLGEKPLVVGGVLLQGIGFGWIAAIAAPDLAYMQLVAPLILAGGGVSMAMPAAQNAILGAVAPNEVGKASGTFNMLRYLGAVFGIAVVVAAFAATGSVGSPTAFSAGFVPALGICAGLSLLAALAGLWLPGRRVVALVPAGAKA